MKKCPQCNSVYSDDFFYCSNDGTDLIAENLSLPTQNDGIEAETVIRRDPIIVNVSRPETALPPPDFNTPYIPQAAPPVIEKTPRSRNYAVFLFLGLLLGGGLVLATLLAAGYFFKPNETEKNVRVSTVQNRNTETVNTGRNSEIDESADDVHRRKDADKPDGDFNGRVIMLNAYVRSAPAPNARQVDILPVDDRINIERREHSNSPWYYVSCEHGISGWMHGNTIEFTDGNF